jgi:hypothetical protein
LDETLKPKTTTILRSIPLKKFLYLIDTRKNGYLYLDESTSTVDENQEDILCFDQSEKDKNFTFCSQSINSLKFSLFIDQKQKKSKILFKNIAQSEKTGKCLADQELEIINSLTLDGELSIRVKSLVGFFLSVLSRKILISRRFDYKEQLKKSVYAEKYLIIHGLMMKEVIRIFMFMYSQGEYEKSKNQVRKKYGRDFFCWQQLDEKDKNFIWETLKASPQSYKFSVTCPLLFDFIDRLTFWNISIKMLKEQI